MKKQLIIIAIAALALTGCKSQRNLETLRQIDREVQQIDHIVQVCSDSECYDQVRAYLESIEQKVDSLKENEK